MSAHLIVGIDPGVKTGYAVWDAAAQELTDLATLGIVDAMHRIRVLVNYGSLHSVRFEDARLRKWLGDKGLEALQGAGSIKRDCSIWQEFLSGLDGVPFLPVSPQSKGAKVDAERFKRLTGWQGRTSNHARDAAMLVFGVGRNK